MKYLADHPIVRESIAELRTGAPATFKGLTIAPLLRPTPAEPDWLLLDEALAGGIAEVTEINQVGSVPTLHVHNGGERALLMLDGEELIGAKQNRVLNTTVLVGAKQSVEIPVSCVEQGRWGYRSHRFASSDRAMYASVRREKVSQVHESLRTSKKHRSDQGLIWNLLADRAAAFRVQSPTGAMADVFEAKRATLSEYRVALMPIAGQVGAVVYGGTAWWGLELLPGPQTFAKAWPRLLSGYAMDALWSEVPATPDENPQERLDALLRVGVELFTGVGMGEEYRFRTRTIVGAALVAEGVVAHLMMFPNSR
jgi:hypothetical protein